MSEAEIETKVDEVIYSPFLNDLLLRNVLILAKSITRTIEDIAKVATDAYKVLDPFFKARGVYLDEFIRNSNKDVINIILVYDEEILLKRFDKYLCKENLQKIFENHNSDKKVNIILVKNADATCISFNNVDVGIRGLLSTDIPDDEYYAIGVDTKETLQHTNEEYLGVPFVNIYYSPEALAKAN